MIIFDFLFDGLFIMDVEQQDVLVGTAVSSAPA